MIDMGNNKGLVKGMFGIDLPDGCEYIASRGLVVPGDFIEGVVNGMERVGERMDYAWRHRDSDRVLIDVSVKGVIRTFSVVRFVNREEKELFVMRYGLYDGVGDNNIVMDGKLN